MRALLPPVCLALLLGCHAPQEQAPVSDRSAALEVISCASELLDNLPGELRGKAQRAFDDPERTQWAFVPGRYAGVELGALDAASRARVQQLLRALLSFEGYTKCTGIIELEHHLRELAVNAGQDGSFRDPLRYSLLVCGAPAIDESFSVRFQGHHLSLNFCFEDGVLVGATPQFFGSNPHEIRVGPRAGIRVLAAEEDLARALLHSFDGAQLVAAVIDGSAPSDVVLGAGVPFSTLGEQRGLSYRAMNAAQRQQLSALVANTVQNLRGAFAAAEMERLEPQFESLYFAWAGSSERGLGHYWRVHGPTFAIEYDNTQDDVNHVHIVWRDLTRDFGVGLLHDHLEEAH